MSEDSVALRALIVALFAGSVFMSLCKGALQNFSKARFLALTAANPRGERLRRYLDDTEGLSLTAMVLDELFDVCFIALVIGALVGKVSSAAEFALLAAAAIAAVLALGEALPWALGRVRAEDVLVVALPVLRAIYIGCAPVRVPLRHFGRAIERMRPSGVHRVSRGRDIAGEILSAVSESDAGARLDEAERDMIEGIVELRDANVREVMTPRTKMVSVEVSTPLSEAKRIIFETGHSRLPVYEKNRDGIVGVLYAKDLVGRDREVSSIAEAMRKAYFVPETKSVSELLKEFRKRKIHIGIVVDEYGGTAGIVTMDDILEQVVGEIDDEYDTEEDVMIRRVGQNVAEVNARASIGEVNEEMDIQLPESEEFSTVGGLVFALLGKVPSPGEQVGTSGVVLTVLEADERKINKLKLEVKPRESSR